MPYPRYRHRDGPPRTEYGDEQVYGGTILHVTPRRFRGVVDVFERYDDQSLSFTDATAAALVEHRDLDAVLSFDDGFDGVVERVDPETAPGTG